MTGSYFPLDPAEHVRQQLRAIVKDYNPAAQAQRQLRDALSSYDPYVQIRRQLKAAIAEANATSQAQRQLHSVLESYDPTVWVRQQISNILTVHNPNEQLRRQMAEQQQRLFKSLYRGLSTTGAIERIVLNQVGRAFASEYVPVATDEAELEDSATRNEINYWIGENAIKIAIWHTALLFAILWVLTLQFDPGMIDQLDKALGTPLAVIGLVLAIKKINPQ